MATADEQDTGNAETAAADGKPSRAEKRAAAEQSASEEPRFSNERLLGPDGPTITGHPTHVLAGALHDSDTGDLTRAQVNRKVDTFLNRPVTQEG